MDIIIGRIYQTIIRSANTNLQCVSVLPPMYGLTSTSTSRSKMFNKMLEKDSLDYGVFYVGMGRRLVYSPATADEECLDELLPHFMFKYIDDWKNKVVLQTSPWIDVVSKDDKVAERSEKALLEELAHAEFLGVQAVIIPLTSSECEKLGKLVNSFLKQQKSQMLEWAIKGRVGVCLVLNEHIPLEDFWFLTKAELDRWLAEPIAAIHVEGALFKFYDKSMYSGGGLAAGRFGGSEEPIGGLRFARFLYLLLRGGGAPRLLLGEHSGVEYKPTEIFNVDVADTTATFNASWMALDAKEVKINGQAGQLDNQDTEQVDLDTSRNGLLERTTDDLVSVASNPPNKNPYLEELQRFKKTARVSAYEHLWFGEPEALGLPAEPVTVEEFLAEAKDERRTNALVLAIEYALLRWNAHTELPAKGGFTSEQQKFDALTVVVLGARCGHVVSCVLRALQENVKIKGRPTIYAVEENPGCFQTLSARCKNDGEWAKVVAVGCAPRLFQLGPPEKADIVINNYIGPFADDRGAPDILHGVSQFLAEEGQIIPEKYRNFIAPVHAPKLASLLNGRERTLKGREGDTVYDRYYEVSPGSSHLIADPGNLFDFKDPHYQDTGKDAWATIEFVANSHCQLHGFFGYVEIKLNKEQRLSSRPETWKNKGLLMKPVFFPLKMAIELRKGQGFSVEFRRRKYLKCWYEWKMVDMNRSTETEVNWDNKPPGWDRVHNRDGEGFKWEFPYLHNFDRYPKRDLSRANETTMSEFGTNVSVAAETSAVMDTTIMMDMLQERHAIEKEYRCNRGLDSMLNMTALKL